MRSVWTIVVLGSLAACTKKGGNDDKTRDQVGAGTPNADKGGSGGVPTGAPGGPRGGDGFKFDIGLDGDFEAVGAVDKDTVRKVVKDNVTRLQTCYEQTLMANPDIAGTVTATFTVDNGSVTNVKASGVHPDVEVCVIKAVQLFKFPPGGKVDVTYPFTFKPAS